MAQLARAANTRVLGSAPSFMTCTTLITSLLGVNVAGLSCKKNSGGATIDQCTSGIFFHSAIFIWLAPPLFF